MPEQDGGDRSPGQPGASGTRVTMADVARSAGLSTALVSIVMRGVPGASQQTRQHVMAVAEELGYVLDQRARKLRQSRSRLLGVTFELQQPFHGDVVEHLYAAAAARDYDLSLSAVAPTRSEDDAFEALARERCEAVVLLGSSSSSAVLRRWGHRLPSLLVARRSEVDGVASVRGDDEAGAGLAVDHLVSLGHRRIVHVDGAGAPGSTDRRAGFVAAARRHRLGGSARVLTGGHTETAGAEVMVHLMEQPGPPTAVVAFNDRCATGILDVLARRGLGTPSDVSVVGYDDSRLARLPHVQLTTVSQDARELARAAVEGALSLVDGAPAADRVIAPRLVVRSTTGAPRP